MKKISILLLLISLALSPCFWLPFFGKIIVYKFIILIVIACLNWKMFLYKSNIWFGFLIIMFACRFYWENNEFNSIFVVFFLPLINCSLFFHFGRLRLVGIDDLKIVSLVSSLMCYLIIATTIWKLPIQLPFEYYEEFYSQNTSLFEAPTLAITGFSFGRTFWSASIAPYACLSLLFFLPTNEHDKEHYFSLFFIAIPIIIAQFLSGGRGGILSTLLVCSYITFRTSKNKITMFILSIILFFVVIQCAISFSDFFRLSSGDITANRGDQYQVLLDNITSLSWGGLGNRGSYDFLSKYGVNYEFHNVIIRLLIDFGYMGGLMIGGWLYYIYCAWKSAKIFYQGKNKYFLVTGIFLVCIFTSFFEPNPIYNGCYWGVFWYLLGYFYEIYKNKDFLMQPQNNNINF